MLYVDRYCACITNKKIKFSERADYGHTKKKVSVSHIYIGLDFDRYCACVTNKKNQIFRKGTLWAHQIKKKQSAIFTLGYILTDIVLVSPTKNSNTLKGHTMGTPNKKKINPIPHGL